MKLTIISVLEMMIVEFDTLENIWEIYATFFKNNRSLHNQPLRKINQEDYRKDYEGFLRKLDKFLKIS